MIALVAWVVFPLAMLAVLLGLGLLAERLAGVALPAALVPPLGFAVSVVAASLAYAPGFGEWLPLAALLALAASGFALARGGLWPRFRPGLGALAGLAAYVLFLAPVLLSGHATFLGYDFLNDTSIHLLLVDWVNHYGGQSVGSLPPSSFASAAQAYVGNHYPLGSHDVLAFFQALFDIEPARIYQPYLALSIGLAASALFSLLRRAAAPAPALAAAAGGLLAVSGQLLFSFDLQGGIKELTMVTCLATAAAVGAELVSSQRAVRWAALLALPALAEYEIYGVAALAWIAPLALLVAGLGLGLRTGALRRRLTRAVGVAAGLFLLLGLPAIVQSIDFYRYGHSGLTSGSELGPLLGPLRKVQVAGIWLQGDYRILPAQPNRTYVLIGIAFALALLGLWLVLRLRAAGPLLFLAPALVAWVAVSPSSSPYVDAKLLVLLSPAVLLFAGIGVAALWPLARSVPAAIAALVLMGAVGYSDATAYRMAYLAPMGRLGELAKIGREFKGQGPMLVNEFEEYAKHFARDAGPVDPYEHWTPEPARLLDPKRPVYAAAYTLDELDFGYVKSFPLIAVRRSPAESRPPAGYVRVFHGNWYDVWRRSAPTSLSHTPLGTPEEDPYSPTAEPACVRLGSISRTSPLLAAERPPAVLFDLSRAALPSGWRHDQNDRLALDAAGGGSVSATARTPGGVQRVWLKGRLYRDDAVYIDGRRVGTAKHTNGPNQWVDVGTVRLAPGVHRAEVRRPTGSLAPGDGKTDILGPLVVEPDAPARIVSVPRGKGEELCGRQLDWIEQPPR